MAIKPLSEGARVPTVSFPVRAGHAWSQLTTDQLFGGKRMVVFSLPGAFTPTCSASHVPRYQELLPQFRALGIDGVACVSVNDTFVMNAWQVDQGAPDVQFVPDGTGAFTQAMGMLVDKSAIGFGMRS